jgi:hypothetical protein
LLAASQGTSSCPHAALFFTITLLGISSGTGFTPSVKLAYTQTLAGITGGGNANHVHRQLV